jgi:alpha-beta hydrolase superfamily lysophospholipase
MAEYLTLQVQYSRIRRFPQQKFMNPPLRTLLALVAVCTLTACAPAEQRYRKSADAPRLTATHLVTGDGHRLPVTRWLPKGDAAPKAVIVALHGFNDYSNAFAIPGKYFRRRGVALYAYDQRGFGRTRYHGVWAGQSNLTRDLRQMVQVVAKRHPGVPLFLLGESMGGAVVVATLAATPPPEVKGAILTAPAVWGDETMNALYRNTLWLAAHTMPRMRLSGRGLKILASDNIEMLRAMSKDPLIIKRTRVDAVYGIVRLMDTAYRKIGKIQTPLLLLYGANDQVIPKDSVQRAIRRIAAPLHSAYYPEGYHMLLRDLKGRVVQKDILAWIGNPYHMLPSGYDRECRKRMEASHRR